MSSEQEQPIASHHGALLYHDRVDQMHSNIIGSKEKNVLWLSSITSIRYARRVPLWVILFIVISLLVIRLVFTSSWVDEINMLLKLLIIMTLFLSLFQILLLNIKTSIILFSKNPQSKMVIDCEANEKPEEFFEQLEKTISKDNYRRAHIRRVN